MRPARKRDMSSSSRPITGEFFDLFLSSGKFFGRAKWICAISCRNAEEMLNEQGKPKTSHTTNKVPLVMANAPAGWSLKKQDGVLGDVAPTILEVMGLGQPEEMSGTSLVVKA